MSNNTVKAIIIGLGILITSCGKKEDPIVKNNTIIACIGDSVTYGGEHGYVEYLQKYMNDSVPEKKVTLLNWGKNSETITHLTETGHPGPRPFLFDRLDIITKTGYSNFLLWNELWNIWTSFRGTFYDL
ncbi:hypothetical protein [Aquimarina algiphila]|uniref:hypothetical protein n=1 Tax=Aquimarina algiphila TaxID=2047982 RepID=UPI00232D4788|nr:hypothetical protein [Aquimarina algiphila]